MMQLNRYKSVMQCAATLRHAHHPLAACLLAACLVLPVSVHSAEKRPVDYVDPLVGTASLEDQALVGNAPPPGEETYTGFTYPGPALPHRDILIGPINKDLTDAANNHGIIYRYIHQRRTMLGFTSPMHGLTIMPVVGDWTVPPDRTYASPYDKSREKASPGYYTVFFPDSGIKVELTTTENTGLYRFTYPETTRGAVLIDLGVRDNQIEIVGDRTVRGRNRGRTFVAEFSKPFKSFGTFRQQPPRLDGGRVHRDDAVFPGSRNGSGSYSGSFLEFTTTRGEQIQVRIAASHNYEAAEALLRAENPSWDFEGIWKKAENAWNEKLSRVQIKGGTEKERRMFYSTLYHSLMTPRLVAERGEPHGRDRRTLDYDRYSPIAFWDTGRNQVVLLTLLEPELKTNILRTHLEMARESGWMHTSFHGDNAVFMYLGDWDRGLQFDWESVYEYLRKNATDPKGPRELLAEYNEKGWIHDVPEDRPSPPHAGGNAGIAKTLEYCWSDHALALYAKKLGKEHDYQFFLARAHNYTNVFDRSTEFMRGRTRDGQWLSPFDPFEPYYNHMMKEASGWQTLWLVPHDVQGLINLLGGRDRFNEKLDFFFNTPYRPTGIAPDVTGMMGLYCQGNQPDQHAPYLYNYSGQPWKTQELVRKILRLMYGSDRKGIGFPGMDDQGAMASWYVLSAMGFYTVDPSRPDYIIGSPLFDEVKINVGGKEFVIQAQNNSEKNMYIQSATLNGKPWNKTWFSHADIANGGKLTLRMGSKPNKNWGTAAESAPPSLTPQH